MHTKIPWAMPCTNDYHSPAGMGPFLFNTQGTPPLPPSLFELGWTSRVGYPGLLIEQAVGHPLGDLIHLNLPPLREGHSHELADSPLNKFIYYCLRFFLVLRYLLVAQIMFKCIDWAIIVFGLYSQSKGKARVNLVSLRLQ